MTVVSVFYHFCYPALQVYTLFLQGVSCLETKYLHLFNIKSNIQYFLMIAKLYLG